MDDMTQADIEKEYAMAVEWARSRPDVIKDLMRKFPPRCVVRSAPGHSHHIPADGGIAHVVSYNENGCVGVTDDRRRLAHCAPDAIEIVEFFVNPLLGNVTVDCDFMHMIIDGADC